MAKQSTVSIVGDHVSDASVDGSNVDDSGKLVGNEKAKADGQFVLDGQTTSKTHRNVSRTWADKCISWDQLLEELQRSSERNEDELIELKHTSIEFDEEKEKPVFQIGDSSRRFAFSGHSGNQIGTFTGLGQRLLGVAKDSEEKEMITQLYSKRWNDYVDSQSHHKRGLFRVRDIGSDGASLRAILSDEYLNVNHFWLSEVIRQQVGDSALISHFEKDRFYDGLDNAGDVIKYNVLIADQVRKETDSDYGGMFSVANSEIGTRRFCAMPSLFRAICMNGCIWGSVHDDKFQVKRVHRGSINLKELAIEIKTKLQEAIPLLPQAVDKMLSLKNFEMISGITAEQVLASLANREKYTKDQKKELYLSYMEEPSQNAFGVVNAFTRFAQNDRFSYLEQEQIENRAGSYLESWNDSAKEWELVQRNAAKIDWSKEKEKVLGIAG